MFASSALPKNLTSYTRNFQVMQMNQTKGLVDMYMENMDSTKMGADKSAENYPNTPKFICPSPKVWDLDE